MGRPREWAIRAALPVVAALLGAPAAPTRAQVEEPSARPPEWAGHVAFTAGNALVGGVAAGLVRTLRGHPFWPAFRDGAIGGALAYGGRRVAAERFDGAGLLGRQLGAIGSSVTANAIRGAPALDRIVLPLGLVRLHLRSDTASLLPTRAHVAVDLPTVVAAAYLAIESGVEFDLEASLSSGAPVFESRVRWADGYWSGTQAAGVIWLRGNPEDPLPDAERAAALAHERVHVLQYDFGMLLLSEPAEAWLADMVPGGAWLDRRFDLGLHLAPWALANALLPYEQRPWEQEAWFLSDVRSDP